MKQFIFASILAFTANPTYAEVTALANHGFTIQNQIDTPVSALEAWDYLVNDVDQWWPKDHSWWGDEGTFSIDAKAGGCFCEIAGQRSAQHMMVSFVDQGKLLRMTGGLGPLQGMGMFGALNWQFSPSERGTTITLTYQVNGVVEGGFEKLAPIVDKVQAQQLNQLKQWIYSATSSTQ